MIGVHLVHVTLGLLDEGGGVAWPLFELAIDPIVRLEVLHHVHAAMRTPCGPRPPYLAGGRLESDDWKEVRQSSHDVGRMVRGVIDHNVQGRELSGEVLHELGVRGCAKVDCNLAFWVIQAHARRVDVDTVQFERLAKVRLPHLERSSALHAQLKHAKGLAGGTQRGEMRLIDMKVVAGLVNHAIVGFPRRYETLKVISESVSAVHGRSSIGARVHRSTANQEVSRHRTVPVTGTGKSRFKVTGGAGTPGHTRKSRYTYSTGKKTPGGPGTGTGTVPVLATVPVIVEAPRGVPGIERARAHYDPII